jgi:tetratricopeptide (TPR) repeat protein
MRAVTATIKPYLQVPSWVSLIGFPEADVQAFRTRVLLLVLLGNLSFPALPASAQNETDAAYKTERDKAISLYGENKQLEALPLFQDLAAKNPKDDKVLLGLAACLVSHSATVSDPDVADKERVQAKELLLKARDLGNNSTLLQNLLQVLQALPQGGQIRYSENPAADEAIRTAEAAFARRDYDEAIKNYSHALELDPKNSSAALFVGDSYFSKKDFANAGQWYGRASQIDPNSETPYRYYADMLTKNGDMEAARTKAIQAVVAEPYNPITWRGLAQWANANRIQLVRVHINVPDNVAQKDANNITITLPPGSTSNSNVAWFAYSSARALWLGDKFKKQFPQETHYRHSLAEEADALTTTAKVWSELNEKNTSANSPGPDLDLLMKIYKSDMIEPYVLLSAADAGIATDYAEYRENNRAKLEQYLSQFVVPPAPVKQ